MKPTCTFTGQSDKGIIIWWGACDNDGLCWCPV